MKYCGFLIDLKGRGVACAALLVVFVGIVTYTGCTSSTESGPSVQPTFSSIQTNIFDKNCTTSSCHSAFGNAGGLVLTADQSYQNLVGAACTNDTARARHYLRVCAGKPDSSFILIKLNGPRAGEGAKMPNVSGGALPADQIEAVRQWIASGAAKN